MNQQTVSLNDLFLVYHIVNTTHKFNTMATRHSLINISILILPTAKFKKKYKSTFQKTNQFRVNDLRAQMCWLLHIILNVKWKLVILQYKKKQVNNYQHRRKQRNFKVVKLLNQITNEMNAEIYYSNLKRLIFMLVNFWWVLCFILFFFRFRCASVYMWWCDDMCFWHTFKIWDCYQLLHDVYADCMAPF